MNKLIAIVPILAHGGRQAAKAPEGSTASGKALGEIACLSPDDVLERLSSAATGLTPGRGAASFSGSKPSGSPGPQHDSR